MKNDETSAPGDDLKNETQSAKQIHAYKNADNHDLLPGDEIPTLAIGNVPEVNGFGAEEVRVAIWRNFNDWANGTASSSGWRRIFFAWRPTIGKRSYASSVETNKRNVRCQSSAISLRNLEIEANAGWQALPCRRGRRDL